jgi:hypothetical protein
MEKEMAKLKNDVVLPVGKIPIKETIDGQTWYCLFGVDKNSSFGFEDPFWTTKSQLNVGSAQKFTSSFKLLSFYTKPISQILIVAECG